MARIILADDDELVGEVVRDALQSAGHVVGVVPDGLAALRALHAKRPDLAILDCNMPGMPGVEVLRQVRLSADLYLLPVIMLTARQSPRDVELALNAGADDYLKKPFDPEELVAIVELALAKSRESSAGARR